MEELINLQTIRETAQREKTLLENLEQHLNHIFPSIKSTEINTLKQSYKVMNGVFTNFKQWLYILERRGLSIKLLDSININYPLLAEFIAYHHGLDDDEPIDFYERDNIFTKKQFEKRNYICSLLPHERAKILNFSEEEKKEQKKFKYNGYDHSYPYPERPSSLYDYTKDIYEVWDKEKCNMLKKEYAYNYSYRVPTYETLYGIIIKNNLSSNMLWQSEIKFGKSKAACIYHIALHFNDFSIFHLSKPLCSEEEYIERLKMWLQINGCDSNI